MGPLVPSERTSRADEGFEAPDVKTELSRFYYDSAGGFALSIQIPALKGISSPEHILYGSDYPFAVASSCAKRLGELRNTELLTEDEIAGVLRSNALKLFPRFTDAV